MTRSLVTGGFGFIGRYLTPLLLEAGHRVTLLDIATNAQWLAKLGDDVNAIRASVADWAQLAAAVSDTRPDVIFHSGALLPPASEEYPQAAFHVNIEGTYNVLETARLFDVKQVVYASSVASFGPDAPRELVPNQSAQHPATLYGVSKVCSERLGEYYVRRYGIDFRAVRFPALFGPGRAASSGFTAYTSVAIEESANGRPYAFKAEPPTATGILYVRDAARSLLDLANADGSRLTQRAYNVHGFVVTARELCDAVLRQIPDAELSFEPDEEVTAFLNSIPRQIDDSMARADWDWQPRHTLDEAIADFVATLRAA
jgi:threonine 3-dehydrogenase